MTDDVYPTDVFTAVIERLPSGVLTAWVPGFPGAQAQGATIDEACDTLHDVLRRLMREHVELTSEFVGIMIIRVPDKYPFIREELVQHWKLP